MKYLLFIEHFLPFTYVSTTMFGNQATNAFNEMMSARSTRSVVAESRLSDNDPSAVMVLKTENQPQAMNKQVESLAFGSQFL